MAQQAKGTFEVKVTPTPYEAKDAVASGRLTLAKTFAGDLAGTSQGEMWTADTTVQGSAGYVAMEQVTGALDGRRGSFALQHTGTMTRGTPQLSVTVVPDSAREQLVGLSGRMEIKIEDGKHFYEFEYTLVGDVAS